MITSTPQSREFDAQRRKKALLYTAGICGAILLMFFLISWRIMPPPPPPLEQMIEVNLGNFEEGMGDVQPLVKGERGPSKEYIEPTPAYSEPEAEEKVVPDENADEDAAAVNKPVKVNNKPKPVNTSAPIVSVPKPQKPKITYDGPGKGTGNNPDEDNGYRYQGNKPGGSGDAGSPTGNKDSYGNSPGGAIGGRKIIRNVSPSKSYSFTGNLPKATIYAIIRISETGRGTFVGFDKGSTTRDNRYAEEIKEKLLNIQFQKSDYGSTATVPFNFKQN